MKKSLKFLCILICLIGSLLSSPFTAYAGYVTSDSITGEEDAMNPDDFGGNVTLQNEFKIWSICKSFGMTDEQALGILGCFACEGSFHPEAVEAKFGWGDTVDSVNTYIANYSDPFTTDHDTFTVEALKAYHTNATYGPMPDEAIESGRNGNNWSGNGINESGYFISGTGYCGVGMAGFTGGRCKSLLDWCSANSCEWYIMENQMIWGLTPPVDGGDSSSPLWAAYKLETNEFTVNECTEWWAKHYENANMSASEIGKRQDAANALYSTFVGKAWDVEYGDGIVSLAGIEPSKKKDGINDRSIIASYVSAVLYYPLNSGYILNFEENSSFNAKNQEIFKGYVRSLQGNDDTSTTYSLYELFGEDIHWYRYMGEATYSPNLLDHIWSAINQNKTNKLQVQETIDYEPNNYLSCHVYPDRPDVLTIENWMNGYKDPRVDSLIGGIFNGYTYVLGTIQMSIAKYSVAIMSILMGHEVLDVFVDIITEIETSDTFDLIKGPIMFILGLAMIAFIVSLIRSGIRYAKGTGAAMETISRFLVGFVSLGLLFAALARPTVFNDVIVKGLTTVDQFFEASLAMAIEDDEVIAVTDDDLAVHAALWKTCIFNPWCRGQFNGLEYEKLYTNYASIDTSLGQKHMKQSNQVVDPADTTGKAFFNSTALTGDVFVPVGGGKTIRNWAAYLYSCGSKYHIDSTLDAEAAELLDANANASFPMAKTTANDSTLFADTFRVIDAQMDISPQYYADGTVSYNYTNAHNIKNRFAKEGTVMMLNALLLFVMIPPVAKKIMSFMLLLLTTLKMIYYTILELFKADTGFKDFWQSFKKNIIDYFTACIKLDILITLYLMFVDKGILKAILYLLVSFAVLGFNVQDARRFISNAKHTLKTIKNKF